MHSKIPNTRGHGIKTSSASISTTVYLIPFKMFEQSTRRVWILQFSGKHTESIYGSCRKTQPTSFLPRTFGCELLSRQNTDAYTIPLLTMTTDCCSIPSLRSHESVKLRGFPCLPSPALCTQRLPSCLSVFRFVWFLRRDILLFVIVIGPRTNPSIFGLPKQTRTPPKGGGKQRNATFLI